MVPTPAKRTSFRRPPRFQPSRQSLRHVHASGTTRHVLSERTSGSRSAAGIAGAGEQAEIPDEGLRGDSVNLLRRRLRLQDVALAGGGGRFVVEEDVVGTVGAGEKGTDAGGGEPGLDDLNGKFLQLHLHYIYIRRKPYGLIARAWGKSLPGPAHGLEPTAQQLRPLNI